MPSIRPYRGVTPQIAASAYIDESARIVGDVVVADACSVWLNAVVRGDVNYVRIGARTNLQDGVLVHVNRDPSHPTVVGEDVTVGHGAILHGCTIGDRCLVGMGAILLNGCRVGTGSIVAAGTLVTEGTEIPAGSLVMGSPGRVRRPVTDAETTFIAQSAANYVQYRLAYVSEA